MEQRAGTGVRTHRVRNEEVTDCARALSDVVETIFRVLDGLAEGLSAEWRRAASAQEPFTTSNLTVLQPLIFSALDRRAEFDSAGYVLEGAVLADRHRYLEWWHRSDGASFQPLILNLDPASPDHYDYYSMEWFLAARDHHRRFVSGPLIDLPCAEAHIMTFSLPVVADGVFVGIAGADVAMARLELLTVPPMLRLPAPSVLVNSSRRVIAASDARWAPGDKLRSVPSGDEPDWQAVVPVTSDLGWVLAVAAV